MIDKERNLYDFGIALIRKCFFWMRRQGQKSPELTIKALSLNDNLTKIQKSSALLFTQKRPKEIFDLWINKKAINQPKDS